VHVVVKVSARALQVFEKQISITKKPSMRRVFCYLVLPAGDRLSAVRQEPALQAPPGEEHLNLCLVRLKTNYSTIILLQTGGLFLVSFQ